MPQSNRRSLEGKREKWMEEVLFGGGATKAEVKFLTMDSISPSASSASPSFAPVTVDSGSVRVSSSMTALPSPSATSACSSLHSISPAGNLHSSSLARRMHGVAAGVCLHSTQPCASRSRRLREIPCSVQVGQSILLQAVRWSAARAFLLAYSRVLWTFGHFLLLAGGCQVSGLSAVYASSNWSFCSLPSFVLSFVHLLPFIPLFLLFL